MGSPHSLAPVLVRVLSFIPSLSYPPKQQKGSLEKKTLRKSVLILCVHDKSWYTSENVIKFGEIFILNCFT